MITIQRVGLSCLFTVLALSTACPAADAGEGEGEGEGEGDAPEPRLDAVGVELERSTLAIHGVNEHVWVVGSTIQKKSLIAHYDGAAWSRDENSYDVNLFAVHAFAENDVWVGGSGGTLLHYDGSTWTRQTVPGLASHTVFALWGAAPDDVWAVGAQLGRYGFLWHFDGSSWQSVPLPDDLPLDGRGELPGLFSVWGRSSNAVWVTGAAGTFMHYDGSAWSTIPTGLTDALFDVTGNETEVMAVGGTFTGVILNEDGVVTSENLFVPLQTGWLEADGTAWVAGATGAVYVRRPGRPWRRVPPDDVVMQVASVGGSYVDSNKRTFFVGGNVLSPPFDTGFVGIAAPEGAPAVAALLRQEPPPPPDPVCPAGRVDIVPGASMARSLDELMVDGIRRDLPRPGVHARNLFHVSAAIYDAWASYDETVDGFLSSDKVVPVDLETERNEAIAHAGYRMLVHRYQNAIGGAVTKACLDDFMALKGYDITDTSTSGDEPARVGNRVAQALIDAFANDGANEGENYADTTSYFPTNNAMIVENPGAKANDPDVWQELSLQTAVSQNGIPIAAGAQEYIGSNWRNVTAFALPPDDDGDGLRLDAPPPPSFYDDEMKDHVRSLLIQSAELSPALAATIDISPGAYGNNPVGSNAGSGHTENPVTGEPYATNVVKKGDFVRVLAEFWADGPKSETPPGHWNVVANDASDMLAELNAPLVPFASGAPVDRLSWDVLMYFTINGAVHDAAITAWSVKRVFLGSRPITLVRAMAEYGQSSDPSQPSYDVRGLPLIPNVSEVITEASSAPGERHAHLKFWIGEVAVVSWRGEPGDRANEIGDVGWIRAKDWIPYQRRNFVTPGFPGYISGHSTFSRAAAEVLAVFTGSAFFPGGFAEFVAQPGNYLVFEDGPSEAVRLQWGTYFDAADQAGQSRLWGGIHIEPDDFQGRLLGQQVGLLAVDAARELINR